MKKISTLLIGLCALLAVVGCQSPFQMDDAHAVKGAGRFVLNIGNNGTGRTIMPVINDGIAAYSLQFSGEATLAVDRTPANIGEAVSLQQGTYNLTVTAYTDAAKTNPIARGTLTGIVITSGGTTSKSLVLGGIVEEGATGTFKYTITFPAAVNADMTITPISEGGSAQQTIPLASGTQAAVTLNSGFYRVTFNLDNGTKAVSRENYLHIYKNMESVFTFTFTEGHFVTYIISSDADDGNEVDPADGSLRYAIKNAEENSTIVIKNTVTEIKLKRRLYIDKSLNIEGNGVKITRDPSWTDNDGDSQFVYIRKGFEPESETPQVRISRVHFTGGHSALGGAICNYDGELWVESCIFSYNKSINGVGGGAILNESGSKGLTVSGCTFYGNTNVTSDYGTAIRSMANEGYFTLTGNIFYYGDVEINWADTRMVHVGGTAEATSGGYNVVDGEYAETIDQMFWNITPLPTDILREEPFVTPVNFKVLTGSAVMHVISSLPADYPETDFYGNAITHGASAGAVQAIANGFLLTTRSSNDALGSAAITTSLNEDGLYSGSVTLTATAQDGGAFLFWLKDGVQAGSASPWTFTPTGHSRIQGVFAHRVNSAADTVTKGTLRYALANIDDGDYILIEPALDGAITIATPLPAITKENITIEGNGATLTRTGAMTINAASQLLAVGEDGVASFSRLHFKDGRATQGGAVKNSGSLKLESCIFSGNISSGAAATDGGGAVYNSGTLTLKACTFYQNSSTGSAQGGAVYQESGSLAMTGNLFYANSGGTAVQAAAGTVTSDGFNVIDTTQSGGWTETQTDKVISVPFISTTPEQYRLLKNSAASTIITPLPADYPAKDFYGDAIANNAAAGAVQTPITGNGIAVLYSVNDPSRGSIVISGTPDEFGLYTSPVTVTTAKTSAFDFIGWSVNGVMEETSETAKTVSAHSVVMAVYGTVVTSYLDDGPGTLRAALAANVANDYIYCKDVTPGVTTITLASVLPTINNSVTIIGNGVTIVKGYATGAYSRLLNIGGSNLYTVRISRVWFKDGNVSSGSGNVYGGAISCTSNLILESCIFSNNKAGVGAYGGYGGAISLGNANVNLELYGCTFFGNQGEDGGAVIRSESTSTTRRWVFVGNVFNRNLKTYSSVSLDYAFSMYANPVWTTSGNLFDFSGYGGSNDKTVLGGVFVAPVSLKPIAGGDAANMLSAIPAGYPAKDFYGTPITAPANAGAIQATSASSGHGFSLTQGAGGTATRTSGTPDAEGLYSGTVVIQATPTAPLELIWWLVNGEKVDCGNTLTLTMDGSKVVKPVFGLKVTSGADSGDGTLRWAVATITNGSSGNNTTIVVTVPEIQLDSQLSISKRYITIDGNGAIIRPSSSWSATSTLLYLPYSNSPAVYITNMHFKDAPYGSITATATSDATNLSSVYLYSCIFSGNQGRPVTASGGRATVRIYHCTFYNNNVGSDALLNQGYSSNPYYEQLRYGEFGVFGCLFYGNTASTLVSYYNAANSYAFIYNNVVDVPIGTGTGQTGWPVSGTYIIDNKTLSELGVSGVPFNTSTFKPNNPALKTGYIYTDSSLPVTDFYGNARNGTVGAVNY
jgi:hypothetical protein